MSFDFNGPTNCTRFSIAIQAERIQGIGLSLCGSTIKAQGSRLRALGDNGFERKI